MDKTIILRDEHTAGAAVQTILMNWKAMAESGHPLAVRFYEHKENATDEQRGLLWIRYGEIADQAWVRGHQYSADCWHEYAKSAFLPDEVGPSKRCRKGYRKFAINPMTGERIMVGSTEGLTTFGKSEYMEQLTAFGASELGVRFSATPREMAA